MMTHHKPQSSLLSPTSNTRTAYLIPVAKDNRTPRGGFEALLKI